MKIKLSALRRLIKEELILLTESQCPVCGTEGAYIGLHDVDCVNPGCAHYTKLASNHDGEIRKIDSRVSLEIQFPGALRAWQKFLIDCEDIDSSVPIDDLFSETQWFVNSNGTLYAHLELNTPSALPCKWDGKSWELSEDEI